MDFKSFLNMNTAEEQKSFDAIPPGSVVVVELKLRMPQMPGADPYLKVSRNGSCQMLDCEFTVTQGAFRGVRFWENMVVLGETAGQKKAADITRQKLRAITESCREIMPDDDSPRAMAARDIHSFQEFDGMVFPVMVGIAPPREGSQYINNCLKKVITPNDKLYAEVKAKGEVITDNPIPQIGQAATPSQPATPWATPQTRNVAQQTTFNMSPAPAPQPTPGFLGSARGNTQPAPQANQTPQASQAPQTPPASQSWGAQFKQPAAPAQAAPQDVNPTAGGVYPSEATGADDIPF